MVSTKFTLKQFLNVPGLKAVALVAASPELIPPHYHLKHVRQINYQLLKDRGIKCLVFDKDNTLRCLFAFSS
jgi:predicted membrane-bound spermidine synthase